MATTERAARGAGGAGGLGTFGGVFTPSILTILGIVLFLRLGWVVGAGGLRRAFALLALATAISVLTSLSLAAIATNRRVRGGGDYYLISRTLGVAYGGALGLVLFLAQAVSVAFYCVGLGEALTALPTFAHLPAAGVAAAAAAVLLGVAWLGADLAMRFQYVIMAAMLAGLASFFAGGLAAWDGARLAGAWAAPPEAAGFWVLFAIFFPAATGFTQGVSMSGDLRDPAASLPRGTLLAVGVSTAVYALAMATFAAGLPLATLSADYGAMGRLARVPALVDAGVIAAALSSALASLLGAPRILQALARDGIFRRLAPFAAGSGPAGNPRRGVLFTGAIALVAIAAGNLDAIAAVVSMFFLVSYGLLNYATYVEATAASPSFRPRFRFFSARASLAGCLLCGGVMLAIQPAAALVALATLGAIHQYLRRTAIPARWRDSRFAFRFRRVKDGLHDLAREPEGPRDWQPNVLVFTDDPERRERVLRFASWITGDSGLVGAVQLVEGDPMLASVRQRCAEAEQALREELAARGLDAFALALAAPDLRMGASAVVQAWGIGPVRANTVLLNWLGTEGGERSASARLHYGRLLRRAIALGQNVVAFDADAAAWRRMEAVAPEERRIDVWWWNDDSSRLALLLAYLTTRTEPWRDARIQVWAPAAEGREEKIGANLRHRIEELRIDATVDAVRDDPDEIAARSATATLVLLPFRLEGMRVVDGFARPAGAVLETLPIAALVAAAGDIELGEEEPSEAAAPPTPERAAADEPA